MHENVTNYDLVTSQQNYWFESKLQLHNCTVEQDRLVSMATTTGSLSDAPAVGNCISGEIDVELMADLHGSATQEAHRGESINWNQLWERAGWHWVQGQYSKDSNNHWWKNADDPFTSTPAVVGHKYYGRLSVKNAINHWQSSIYYGEGVGQCYVTGNGTASSVWTADRTSYAIYRVWDYDSMTSARYFSEFYKLVLIDLTVMFGAGNEPTKAVMDALFPLDYYAPSSAVSTTYNPTDIPRMALMVPYVRAGAVIDGSTVYSGWIPKGKYYVDTREKTHNGNGVDILKLHGYDAMLKAEQACYTTVPVSWNNVRMATVLLHISDSIGVGIQRASYVTINATNFACPFPGIGEGAYTMRECLGMIASAVASNFVVDDNGDLRLIGLVTASTTSNYLLASSGKPLTFGGTRILIHA